jgi:hypothetical protein
MCPAVEAKFQVDGTIQQAYHSVYTALSEIVGTLSIVKEIPPPSGSMPRRPSYVVLEYRGGLFRLRRQIDLTFQENQNRTVVSLKWFYVTQQYQRESTDEWLIDAVGTQDMRERIERRVTELKSKIGASDLEEDSVKEIIKEKEIIVKVRCSHCANLYDATLNRCPHCGGH